MRASGRWEGNCRLAGTFTASHDLLVVGSGTEAQHPALEKHYIHSSVHDGPGVPGGPVPPASLLRLVVPGDGHLPGRE